MAAVRKKAPSPSRQFLVRTNCEYCIEVEAGDAEAAMAKADAIDTAEWDQSWAPIEVDEDA